MLKSSIIPPHPALSDFIYNYTLCKSEAAKISMTIPWFANHETSLCFFLADTPQQIANSKAKNKPEYTNKVTLFGLLTHCKGALKFEGNCNEFIIEFKPNGFNRMFGVPASEICNNILPANEVIGNSVEHFYEQLLHASGVPEMILLADKFLMGFLKRQKALYINEGITQIFRQLKATSTDNIPQYAREANMSMRNFERRFSEQVGTSPKFFGRLLRFNKAVKLKISQPKKSWPDIACECGYYDNLHMIKEFKQFANASPATIFNNNPGFINETFTTIERIEL